MRVLVIGKRSIIANYFKLKFKKKIQIKKISFAQSKKISKNQISKFDWIFNCDFKKNTNNLKNNPDLLLLNKIKNTTTKYIMMSTSKVYGPKKLKIFNEN